MEKKKNIFIFQDVSQGCSMTDNRKDKLIKLNAEVIAEAFLALSRTP
jgi:hypothetical protein